jgi:hypothetical protein
VPSWIGLGFVALLCLMAAVDLRHGRSAAARVVGALGIFGAGGVASWATWSMLFAQAPADVRVVGGGAVAFALVGFIGDWLGELRTRSFTAAITVSCFALLLPSSVSDDPRTGGVLFLGAISIGLGSITGRITRRIAARFYYDDDDGDEAGDAA